MRIKLSAEAAEEMLASAAWYDQREPGLGAEFLVACNQAFAVIASDPKRHLHVGKGFPSLFDAPISFRGFLRNPGRRFDHRGRVSWCPPSTTLAKML